MQKKPPQKILVIRLDEIGDFVMTTAFLRELQSTYPKAKITLVVKPLVYNLAKTCPYVDIVHVYNPQAGGFFAKIKLKWRRIWFAKRYLQKQKFDLAIAPRWDADDHGALPLVDLSLAKRRVGYSEFVSERKKEQNRGYNRYLTDIIEDDSVGHEVEKNLNIIRFLGGEVRNDALELWLTPEDIEEAKKWLVPFKREDKSLVALGIGASRPKRKWPLASFVEVCKRLQEEKNVQFVVIGAEEDFAFGEKLKATLGEDLLNLAGKLSLRGSAAALERCTLFVGNDSGPKHIAAAMQRPVVEMTCHPAKGSKRSCNYPGRVRAWGEGHIVLQPTTCRPPCTCSCYSSQTHCILDVSPESVLTAVKTFSSIDNMLNYIPQSEVTRSARFADQASGLKALRAARATWLNSKPKDDALSKLSELKPGSRRSFP